MWGSKYKCIHNLTIPGVLLNQKHRVDSVISGMVLVENKETILYNYY